MDVKALDSTDIEEISGSKSTTQSWGRDDQCRTQMITSLSYQRPVITLASSYCYYELLVSSDEQKPEMQVVSYHFECLIETLRLSLSGLLGVLSWKVMREIFSVVLRKREFLGLKRDFSLQNTKYFSIFLKCI